MSQLHGIRSRVSVTGLLSAVVLAGADQAIKAWIVKYLENGARVVDVTGFFRLVIIHNEGISFGMLNGLSPQISFALTLFAAAVTIGLLRSEEHTSELQSRFGIS